MQIDLPQQTIDQAKDLATPGIDAAAAVAEVVAKAAFEKQEVAAVTEGIRAYERGEHRPAKEFFAEFMAEQGIRPPE